ncbi:MAG: type IV secretion system protein B4, partial [Hyphomicrobiaceae bacterium]
KTILEALPNQLLFPNRKAVASDYAEYAMTDNELAFILSGRTKGRLALLRGHAGSTILDVDLSALGPLLTALGGGRAGVDRFGADYKSRSNFWRVEG